MIKPTFDFDQQGRAYCKSHPNYKSYADSGGDGWVLEDSKDSFYKCTNCDHYLNDDCLFPQSEIDKIRRDLAFKCVFCGERITKKMNIMYKLKVEHDYHVKIPLTCCDCSAGLASEDSVEKFHSIVLTKLYLGIGMLAIFSVTMYYSLIFLPSYFLIGGISMIFSLSFLYTALTSIRASFKLRKSLKQSELLKTLMEK